MKNKILTLVFVIIQLNTFCQVSTNVTIYTPNGEPVYAKKLVSGDFTSQQKQDSKNYWLNYYNNRITFMDEATLSYNCHGYAWEKEEGSGTSVWLNTPQDDKYWNDGSFIEVSSWSDATTVSFKSDDHSAITTYQQGYFISKWGPSPLFKHTINDCPYKNSSIKYYKLSPNSCREYYENKTITTNTNKTGCILLIKNINVKNNSKLKIDASQYVKIKGPFEIKYGSTLEVK